MDLDTENRIAAILMKEAAELRRQAEKEGVHVYLRQPSVRGRPNSRFLTATVLGVQQANRAVEVNEMWRVRQKELELDDRLKGRMGDDSSSGRSQRDGSDSQRSTNKRHSRIDTNVSDPCSSSKRVVQDSYAREDEALKDEDIDEFLHSRVKRGRGDVGSRMDETGPFLPSCPDSKGKQLASPDVGGNERWKHRVVLGPQKPSSLRSCESSEEDKWKKAKKMDSSKHHSRKHKSKSKSKEKSRDKKKKKREEKRCKHHKREESERHESFLENGSKVLEEFITSWNGRWSIPIRNFSAQELIRSTNNYDPRHLVDEDAYYALCRREESERHESFLENGSKVLEEFITSWNGRWSIPIRNFSAQELIRSINNYDPWHLVDEDAYYALYAGAVRDIVATSQMSCHKNVLKLIGRSLLSLKSRVRIASEIAYAFVYLHTAFSTPTIRRNLKSDIVIIDRCGVAKLLDFSISIVIPPGESQVKDMVISSRSLVEPQYLQTGILTEKTDVYDFGMFLVELLTGQRIADIQLHLQYGCFEDYLHRVGLNEIVDARTREGSGGGVEQEQQLQAFVSLAMQCLQKEREDRPEMIDVAKELKRIQRLVLVHPPSAQTINPL
ncbi:hypothetical protein ACSBR1_019472 [Camellia fascicularis]